MQRFRRLAKPIIAVFSVSCLGLILAYTLGWLDPTGPDPRQGQGKVAASEPSEADDGPSLFERLFQDPPSKEDELGHILPAPSASVPHPTDDREDYLRFSREVGLREAQALLEDAENMVWTDPLEVERLLFDRLAHDCGMNDERCSIPLAAETAITYIRRHLYDLAVKRTANALALSKALASYPQTAPDVRPLTPLDIAIAGRDWKMADGYLKEQIAGKEEADAVLKLVEQIEGRHFEMTELVPELDKSDPDRAMLLRKALSHKYQWLVWTIKSQKAYIEALSRQVASGTTARSTLDEAEQKLEDMETQLAELGSVDSVTNFSSVSVPFPHQ